MSDPSRKEMLQGVLLPLAALSLVGLVFYLSSTSMRSQKKLVGKTAPNLHFTFPDGKRSSLLEQRGKVLLLNFWAAWCGPCLEEMPSLIRLEEHFAESDLLLLAIHVEGKNELLREQQKKYHFPKHTISKFEETEMAPYQVGVVPLTVLIDKSGIIQNFHLGPRQWDDQSILSEIKGLLER